ncbi:DUF397 domain-containing protein [Streptomyces harbinensis]|uniref:DUF397 domain-containing protein n=1 Tax=Streptomyces harbinensis TaxID=1176198 RepID=UPI00370FCE77
MSTELHWYKSSYSNGEGGNCVEVALGWHKSSYSDDEGGNCVEIAATPASVHVRDSKRPTSVPHLTFRPAAFTAFLGSLR